MATSETRYDFTPFGSPLSWISGVIVAGDDESEFLPFGSGFLATPKLALTARHVIDELFHHFTGDLPYRASGELPFGAQLGTADLTSSHIIKWDILDYHYSSSIDITALSIEPSSDADRPIALTLPTFELLPPKKGETVHAFGYPHSKAREVGDNTYKVSLEPRTAVGRVVEVHHQYRDSSSLRFPCFQSNSRFDAGMSGGPVFNNQGRVCGVVCSNLPPENTDEEHVSYSSLIWPALGIKYNSDSDSSGAHPRFVLDDATTGILQVNHLEDFTLDRKTNKIGLKYSP